ncbi:hypothetical protein UPYG_G00191730 [Umbra pygmaea]|uniref:DUF4806 domain-containing protein n=1 Tax=Umbra pygmaea TaxID=75934 RepID=A0ABD0WXM1_UMBPY
MQTPVAPVSLSQADQPQDAFGDHSPNNQENAFSVLRPSDSMQGRTPHHQWDAWHDHPPAIQDNTLDNTRRPYQHPRPSTHQGRMQTPVAPVSLSQADQPQDAWGDHSPNSQGASGVSRWSCISGQCTPVERVILETLHELDMKINHLTSVVQSLAGRSNVPVLVVESEDDVFPLTSMEDLDKLERQLSERGVMQKMVNRLSISGGHTLKKTVWRICSKVFGPVAKQLN